MLQLRLRRVEILYPGTQVPITPGTRLPITTAFWACPPLENIYFNANNKPSQSVCLLHTSAWEEKL